MPSRHGFPSRIALRVEHQYLIQRTRRHLRKPRSLLTRLTFGGRCAHHYAILRAPTLLMTADRGQAQSVEKARQYQTLIPNSRLVVLQSDGYHIAASNPEECVTNVLAFIKEAKRRP